MTQSFGGQCGECSSCGKCDRIIQQSARPLETFQQTSQQITELMEIRNQVISQIKFTDDVLALRKERLKTQLELLGYSQFNQINEEGLKLEGFQVLGRFKKRNHHMG